MKKSTAKLSKEGLELLNDPILYEMLSKITKEIGVTPEEYLLRFEKVLAKNPKAIFSVFENSLC